MDCPDLALARHMNFKDLSEDEFIKRAEIQIECLNAAMENVDVEWVQDSCSDLMLKIEELENAQVEEEEEEEEINDDEQD